MQRKRRTRDPRAVVQVCDTHCGALFGLTPPKYDTEPESPGYKIRRWIWQEYLNFCDKVRALDSYVLVINGDVVEGTWSKFELLTKSPARQFLMARDALRLLARGAVCTYIIEGTAVHTGEDEHALGEELAMLEGELKIKRTTEGAFAHHRAEFYVNGLRHAARHHTSVPGRPWTKASAAGIHMAADRIEALDNNHKPADVLLVAHRHTFSAAQGDASLCVASPSWKGIDRHTRKVTFSDTPKVGGVILDYRNCAFKEMPHVRPYIAVPAQSEAEVFAPTHDE